VFHSEVQHYRKPSNYAAKFRLFIPNIRNTYVNADLQYTFLSQNELDRRIQNAHNFFSPVTNSNQFFISENNNTIRSINIERDFFSPIAIWAGGLMLGQSVTTQSYLASDSIRYLSALTNVADLWGARSWPLFKRKNNDGRSTNLILSGRFLMTRFPRRPNEAENLNLFYGKNMVFATLGISSRKYFQDRYIFNYGKIEDVPVGRTYGITAGIEEDVSRRMYYGFQSAWGDNFPIGYLSSHIEYGTFIRNGKPEQGIFSCIINYYTPLLNIGNWKIRQFIRPTLFLGLNRLPADHISFLEGMKGFGNVNSDATRMFILTLQTQTYARFKVLGFRFGPFVFMSFGMLGNETKGFSDNQLYSLMGVGMLLRNDYLIFKTFQLSFSFYPYIPDRGYNIFKANAYKTTDYGFRDFEINKPGIFDYR
jgi:hypothetical protein